MRADVFEIGANIFNALRENVCHFEIVEEKRAKIV